jgi:hypothetical protein
MIHTESPPAVSDRTMTPTSSVSRFLHAHRALVGVLAVAALLRVAAHVAFGPALFFTDSWAYIDSAYTGEPVGFRPDRPSGYPLLLDAVWLTGTGLAGVTAAQHLAGFATGVVAYVLLTHLGVAKWLAATATALILLDAYALALAEHIMPEAFFTLALTGATALVLLTRRAAWLAAAGTLVAVAITLRSAAVFAVPVFAIYLLLRTGWRPALAAAAGFAVPLAAYLALQLAGGAPVGLNQASGWFLYGRVAEVADCRQVPADTRPLCPRPEDRDKGAAFHVWDSRSAPNQVYAGMGDRNANEALRRFSLAVMRDRPGRYLGTVAADVGRYFTPGSESRAGSDSAISFPDAGRVQLDSNSWVTERRQRYFPELISQVQAPAEPLRIYGRFANIPHPLLGLLALVAMAALLVVPRRRLEIALPLAVALAILVGSTATSAFVLRYIVPLAPLLICAGTLGLWALYERRNGVGPARAQAHPRSS